MLSQADIKVIEETAKDFFEKMTISLSDIGAVLTSNDVVDLNIKLLEPQILIGEKGQTLFEIQRFLKTILNKKLQKIFYLNLDINDYKKKKIEYLKNLANDLANEVALTKEEKTLFPMSAYERRIIHTQLTERPDVFTESKGISQERCVVIKPK